MADDDILKSDRVKELVGRYELAKKHRQSIYMDIDDFVDVADYYFCSDKIGKCLNVLNEAIEQHPDDYFLQTLKINSLICLGRYKQAREMADAIDPDDEHNVLYYNGQLKVLVDHDREAAIKLFDEWLEIEKEFCEDDPDPEKGREDMRDAYLHVCSSLTSGDKAEEGAPYVVEYVKRYVKECSPLTGDEIDMDLIRICNTYELLDSSILLYESVLENNPYLPQGYTTLASLYNCQRRPEEGMQAAELAIAIDPDDGMAHQAYAHSFFCLGNYEKAEEICLKHIEKTGDQSVYCFLGECQINLGKMDAAYDSFCKERHYITEYVWAPEERASRRMNLSTDFWLCGHPTDALRCINLCLRDFPESSEFMLHKGILLLAMQRVNEAKYMFHQSITYSKDRVVRALMISMALAERGMLEEAIEFVLRIPTEEKTARAYLVFPHLAYLNLELGNHDNFAFALKKAIHYVPFLVESIWSDELQGVEEKDYFKVIDNLFYRRHPEQSEGNEE